MLELDIALCSGTEHVNSLLPLAPFQAQRLVCSELVQSSTYNFIVSNANLK